MIVVTIKMDVLPEKRREFLQTIRALTSPTRSNKGCINCHYYQDVEDENIISLVEEWETQEELDNHLRSEQFSVLLGAMNLLSKPPDIKFNAVSYTSGIEALNAARGAITLEN